MTDLANVTRAFEWLLAYHSDLAKLLVEIKAAFSSRGVECVTRDAMDCYQGKTLNKSWSWVPTHVYQFFQPADRPDVLLAVLVTAHAAGIVGPYVTLARFDGTGARARYRDVTYWWNEEGAHAEADTWAATEWSGLRLRQRWFPLENLTGAADVVTRVVEPLLALQDVAPDAAGDADPVS